MNSLKQLLHNHLIRLSTNQLKIFYCLLVHYFIKYKLFISQQSMFNLWCDLNYYCHEFDDSFPDGYDHFDEMTSFCIAHRFYFIDILTNDLITELFVKHIEKETEVMIELLKTLYEQDAYSAIQYVNKELNINDNANELATEIKDFIEQYS